MSSNVHETEDGTEQIRPRNSLSGLTSIYQTIDTVKQDSDTIETKQSPNIISSMVTYPKIHQTSSTSIVFTENQTRDAYKDKIDEIKVNLTFQVESSFEHV